MPTECICITIEGKTIKSNQSRITSGGIVTIPSGVISYSVTNTGRKDISIMSPQSMVSTLKPTESFRFADPRNGDGNSYVTGQPIVIDATDGQVSITFIIP